MLMTKQDAIETLENFRNDYTREDSAICRAIGIAIDTLRQSTGEPEVRRGRWVKLPKSCQADYECSECGAGIGKIKPPYCAICGAIMDLRTPTEVELDIVDSVMMGDTSER